MMVKISRIQGWLALAVVSLAAASVMGADAPGPARRAIAPAAPVVPGSVIASMQEGKYGEAATALEKLVAEAKTAPEKSYYRFLKGVAERLGGKGDDARTTLSSALQADPNGPWASKIRFELAGVELAAGHSAAAEALARLEAETLLAADRKDRLAEVYHAFARKLLTPDDPITPADPSSAHALLSKARELAKGETLKASLLYAMGRAAQAANPKSSAMTQAARPMPIPDYQAYLRDYPKGPDREAVRFHLGEVQLASGRAVEARQTWTDLARELALEGTRLALSKERADLRALSLYLISRTYGIPAPREEASLNLGVAALRRFLADAPSHPKAVRASYEIGASYLARGRNDAAIDGFNAFLKGDGYRVETDEARKDFADLAMTATYQVAQMTQGQGKFDQATEGFRRYLAQFPNGPQSADAQRSIIDIQLQVATEAANRKKYAEARSLWIAFVNQNPLDSRVPSTSYQVGESFEGERKFDEAIASWESLISKFPGTEPASHAQFTIASLFETEKGDPAGAIERFRKVTIEPWKSQADQRVAVMETKALTVISPRAFRSGETAQLKVTTRNLETLTFSAYKLNAEAYFRKKHELGGVQSLDVGLVAPDAEWTVPVPNYGKFKPVVSNYDLKVAVPGVYVVKVSDEKTLQATALVVGSDLDAIVKVSLEQVLVFAQDMKTGLGRKGARVLVADASGVILEKTTGDDGVLLASWDKPIAGMAPNAPLTPDALHYLVIDGPDAAGSGLGVPDKVSQGLSPRAYLYTDRPAYRPGQDVEIRGVVREAKDGQYANPAGEAYKLEIYDARGRLLLARNTTLSAFGTFHEAIRLDSGAPVGSYRIHLFRPGLSDFAGAFEVQSYKLEKLDLDFKLPRMVYYRGETVQGEVIARYQYGAPAASRPIELALPDGRVVRGLTDATGKFAFEFPTEGFAEEQALRLVARLPGDNVQVMAGVVLAIRGFQISLATPRTVYLDGETFALTATTLDAQGKPTSRELKVAILKQVEQDGRITEREVSKATLTTDKETGVGLISLKVEDERGGNFLVRAAGTDQFGNPIVSDRAMTISGKDDETRLRILTDRQTFKVGETAAINLHSRGKPGTALLAWEADRILKYQLMPIKGGDNALSWPVDGPQFPNFTLTASSMNGTKFDEAKLDIRVERDLRVTLKPLKASVGPGEELEVEVTTVDQLGKPVTAEIALALVDQSLLRLFNDNVPTITSYFYNQTRTGAFATEATNTFHDEPTTQPVASAVVEDAERQAAQARNDVGRGAVIGQAQIQFAMPGGGRDAPLSTWATPHPAPAPGMAAPAMAPVARSPDGWLGELDERSASAFRPRQSSPNQDPFDATEALDASNSKDKKAADPSLNYYYALNQPGQQAMGQFGAGVANMRVELGRASNGGTQARALRRIPVPAEFARPRESFAETAYWNPSVVTDKDGKATIKFKGPMALSEYRFSARGVTGSETLVGQATASLVVRKDFFVDLRVPSSLTQGDKPRFLATLHHAGVKGSASLSLSLYSGERQAVYPRTIELKDDGVDEVLFDPFEVPDGESVRLSLTAKVGESTDELVLEVPIRPWGVQAFATASGSSSDGATAYVGLPAGRTYESPEMRIDVSPSLKRLLIDLALDGTPIVRNAMAPTFNCGIVLPDTTADRASDLLAATSALAYLREVRTPEGSEATRLTERISGLVAELVTAQNDDGGWPWITPGQARPKSLSHRMTSAQVARAIQSVRAVGLPFEPSSVDKAATYLASEFNKVGNDLEARSALLHALAGFGKATFEQANALNRSRQALNDVSLAYLALTLGELDRIPLANEVLDILATRAKTEPAGIGKTPRKYWAGANQGPWHRGPVESTALASLAFARVRPRAPEVAASSDWLLAHRFGDGWNPHKAKGVAIAALTAFHGKARDAEDRYRLVVTVNDAEVYRAEVVGAVEGKAFGVPRKVLKVGGDNVVKFAIEGRGTFGYAVTMTGFARDFAPEQKRDGKPFVINSRDYLPAVPEIDGKALPTGFTTVVNPTTFQNRATQVAQGGRARVRITANRSNDRAPGDRDFLVVEETLPAGTTLIEGSVATTASSYNLADNVLTFYFSAEEYPGTITYDIAGYLPGQYRALPTKIRGAYDPGVTHLGNPEDFKVLTPVERNTDPYRATPDELFARGKALFDLGKLAEAAIPLEEVFSGYTPRDDVARAAARMLLTAHIKDYQARKIVQDFEVLKEKGPDLIIPFDEVLVVGRAYRDIGEHERAYLVFRAIIEASYLEDAQVGEALRQRGKPLDAMSYLLDLWRESPNTPSIESDFFGLSQVVTGLASQANTDPNLRRDLAIGEVTRSELLLQAIRLIQVFLSQSPKNPMADEASLALVGAAMELEDFDSVVKLAPRYARLYPKSSFLDSFQYSEALGRFSLGEYDRAIEVAEGIVKATYKDANGVDQPSPNKWQAVYILGQIYDARRNPARAVEYYKQVADRFADAAGAVSAFTRKELKLPEVSTLRPIAPVGEQPSGLKLNAIPERTGVTLDYRNIAEADIKVYPVDLMRLYLTRRNLDGIAGIDLAGITPLLESTAKLGDGLDFADKVKDLDVPLTKEGAYLMMVRGENLYASGIVLVSPLELEVLEESQAGRVRVVVRDSRTKVLMPKVEVKVIGTNNPTFFTGKTDLRGVYVADGVIGQVTAVARKGTGQYAFYRGKEFVGMPAGAKGIPPAPSEPAGAKNDASQSLDQNLRNQNSLNQNRQIDRLQNRYNENRKGIKAEEAK